MYRSLKKYILFIIYKTHRFKMLNKLKNLFTIQKISLAVSIYGVSFQLFVLNPWHKQISNQLNLLENKIEKLEKLEK